MSSDLTTPPSTPTTNECDVLAQPPGAPSRPGRKAPTPPPSPEFVDISVLREMENELMLAVAARKRAEDQVVMLQKNLDDMKKENTELSKHLLGEDRSDFLDKYRIKLTASENKCRQLERKIEKLEEDAVQNDLVLDAKVRNEEQLREEMADLEETVAANRSERAANAEYVKVVERLLSKNMHLQGQVKELGKQIAELNSNRDTEEVAAPKKTPRFQPPPPPPPPEDTPPEGLIKLTADKAELRTRMQTRLSSAKLKADQSFTPQPGEAEMKRELPAYASVGLEPSEMQRRFHQAMAAAVEERDAEMAAAAEQERLHKPGSRESLESRVFMLSNELASAKETIGKMFKEQSDLHAEVVKERRVALELQSQAIEAAQKHCKALEDHIADLTVRKTRVSPKTLEIDSVEFARRFGDLIEELQTANVGKYPLSHVQALFIAATFEKSVPATKQLWHRVLKEYRDKRGDIKAWVVRFTHGTQPATEMYKVYFYHDDALMASSDFRGQSPEHSSHIFGVSIGVNGDEKKQIDASGEGTVAVKSYNVEDDELAMF